MKSILAYIIITINLSVFGQSQDSIRLDNVCKDCLESAILPKPDTLDCYPIITKMWLNIVKKTYEDLYNKLVQEEKKKLYDNQMHWEHSKNIEFEQYNLILENKQRPISERRYSVVKQAKIAKDRAMYLLKL